MVENFFRCHAGAAHVHSAYFQQGRLQEMWGQMGDFLVEYLPEQGVRLLGDPQAQIVAEEAFRGSLQIVGEGPAHEVRHGSPGGVGDVCAAVAHCPQALGKGLAVHHLMVGVVVLDEIEGLEDILHHRYLGDGRQLEASPDDGGVVYCAVGLGGIEIQAPQPAEVTGHIHQEVYIAAGDEPPDILQGIFLDDFQLDIQVGFQLFQEAHGGA